MQREHGGNRAVVVCDIEAPAVRDLLADAGARLASRKLLASPRPVETQLSIQTRPTSSYSSARAGRMMGSGIDVTLSFAGRAPTAAFRPRVLPADRHTASEIWCSCRASGLVLRQTMPMVRDGCGLRKRETDTGAERVSTATAISGIRVTPMPAPTICTSVDSELASSTSRGGEDCMLQNDSA